MFQNAYDSDMLVWFDLKEANQLRRCRAFIPHIPNVPPQETIHSVIGNKTYTIARATLFVASLTLICSIIALLTNR